MGMLPRSVKIQIIFHTVKAVSRRMGMPPRSVKIQIPCHAVKAASRTLQTRLDLYNSELALASSPVLFWNLCVQLEIWTFIVICGLAAVVGQASKAPPPLPPFSFSSLFLRDSCQLRKGSISTSLTPSQYLTLDYGHNYIENMNSVRTLIRKTTDYSVSGNRKLSDEMWEGFKSYYILFLSNWPFCITKNSFFSSKYSVKFEQFAHFDF
jgi:hypothetical protein